MDGAKSMMMSIGNTNKASELELDKNYCCSLDKKPSQYPITHALLGRHAGFLGSSRHGYERREWCNLVVGVSYLSEMPTCQANSQLRLRLSSPGSFELALPSF